MPSSASCRHSPFCGGQWAFVVSSVMRRTGQVRSVRIHARTHVVLANAPYCASRVVAREPVRRRPGGIGRLPAHVSRIRCGVTRASEEVSPVDAFARAVPTTRLGSRSPSARSRHPCLAGRPLVPSFTEPEIPPTAGRPTAQRAQVGLLAADGAPMKDIVERPPKRISCEAPARSCSRRIHGA